GLVQVDGPQLGQRVGHRIDLHHRAAEERRDSQRETRQSKNNSSCPDLRSPAANYSYRSARTGCSRAARRAGSTLNSTAMATAPTLTSTTISGCVSTGILSK